MRQNITLDFEIFQKNTMLMRMSANVKPAILLAIWWQIPTTDTEPASNCQHKLYHRMRNFVSNFENGKPWKLFLGTDQVLWNAGMIFLYEPS